jgi:tRNA A-37 threonylcarbamoyl transferase component Bud32
MIVPAVHSYDADAHVIIMDDAGVGAATLKQLLLDRALAPRLILEIGHVVGAFLAHIHAWGARDDVARTWASGNVLAREIAAWATYGRLLGAVDGTLSAPELRDPPLDVGPEARATLELVARVRAEEILASEETFTMGDFWPGNMLVRTRVGPDGEPALERVFMVDWEICRAGAAGMDVGQFCGDLRVLLQSHPELHVDAELLVAAFVEEYAARRSGQDATWASVAAVHFGVHMATWGPLIPYPNKTRESMRSLVEEGIKIIQEGYTDPNWTAGRFAGLLIK